MHTCEQIQVAHEMWAHGAAGALDQTQVEQHVASCGDCLSYVAQSKRIDTMTAIAAPTLDFSNLRVRVTRKLVSIHRDFWIGVIVYAGFVVLSIYQAKPGLVILMSILGLVLLSKERRRVSSYVQAQALAEAELVSMWRADLARELRSTRWFMWLAPATGALSLGAGLYSRNLELLLYAPALVVVTILVWRSRRSLTRELASLR